MNILLHTCCSNCAIYPFKIVASEGHSFTGLWFNPNIHPFEEYNARLQSLKKLSDMWSIDMLFLEDYGTEEYFGMFGLSDNLAGTKDIIAIDPKLIPRHPERCRRCYELRLGRTAEEASRKGFDAFSTTLLISPYQDFEQIEATGKELADRYNVEFFLKDFRPYFRDAMASAKELGLYRQKYCGCIFSKIERHKGRNQ
jgi:predicted adenine nucleotide alpha hydrolase (AANH) superfamily ATPase